MANSEKFNAEDTLISLLEDARIPIHAKTLLLQSYIQEYGPVSNENGDKIRTLYLQGGSNYKEI